MMMGGGGAREHKPNNYITKCVDLPIVYSLVISKVDSAYITIFLLQYSGTKISEGGSMVGYNAGGVTDHSNYNYHTLRRMDTVTNICSIYPISGAL